MAASSIWAFSQTSTLPLAYLLVAAVTVWPLGLELYRSRSKELPPPHTLIPLIEPFAVGLALASIKAFSARFSIQFLIAILLGIWAFKVLERSWPRSNPRLHLVALLLGLEAILLASAMLPLPRLLTLMLVWLLSLSIVAAALSGIGERAALLLGTVWALLSAQVMWVLLNWHVVYSLPGGYLVVPQGVLVLGGLAYSLGGVYFAQRARLLSRERLLEYLGVSGVVMLLVVFGTPWRP